MTSERQFTESEIAFTAGRVALASGILGSVGATLGWLAWLLARVGNTELVVSAVVGAALGVAIHWIQHYVHVAKRERRGEATHESSGRGSGSRARVALVWAAGFAFLGLVSEHIVAHMAAQFLIPFLASLVTLLPAGLIIGWTMNRGRKGESNALMTLASGLLVGAAITLVTGVLWSIGFGTVPWPSLFAWWGFIGVAMQIGARDQPLSLRVADPVVAVAAVFLATFLINFLPTTRAPYEKLGPLSSLAMMLRVMAADIQQSPDVPATFWLEAEATYQREHPGTRLAPPKVARPVVEPGPVDLRAAVERLTSPAPEYTPNPLLPVGEVERSASIRSWVVIFLFAMGVGIAPAVERALRPADYPNSETYRRDVGLAVAVMAVLVGSCLLARHDRGVAHEATAPSSTLDAH